MKRAILLLLVLLAGCSYPHLIEDGKVNEPYLERVEVNVARVTSLAFVKPVPHAVLTLAQARVKIAASIERELDSESAEKLARVFQAFGFVRGKVDFRAAAAALGAEQVAAFYDTDDKAFYLIDRDASNGFSVWFACWLTHRDLPNEIAATHELVHALQDQAYGLEAYWKRPDENDDARLARQAVVEGEAMYFGFKAIGLKDDVDLEREDLVDAPGDAFEKAPRIARELLVFPYWAGHAFAVAVHRHEPGKPPVLTDTAWKHAPASTAEVLHPDLYFRRLSPVEAPGAAPLELAAATPPAGFTLVRENVLGAFLAGVLLGRADTPGWREDHYRVFENARGELALSWLVRFETPADATSFASAYRSFQAAKGVREGAVDVDGRQVSVVEAPDAETLRALRDATRPSR